ncbi:hypothetical protein VHUM_03721 [Vanrija humicola]|uniref:Phytoene synthase n=1 Tax=Vanrija humicola TaxID=5417 RepID=A0A7D8UYV6_VANHU|nr:hypothetical protein VHUM_03721 [Vanrija humicola]
MRGLTPTSIARSATTVATPRAARMSTTAAVRHQPAKAPAPEPSPAPSTSASSSSPLPRRTPGTPLNAPTTSGGPHESAAYCASLVQKLDPDAWLCSYFWPRREKEWWLAIRAFNPAIAAMRFQFWRDALSAIFSDGAKPLPQHPVVVALAAARAHRPVQKYYLSQLIEARAKAMSQPPAASTLEGHLSAAGQVASALLQGSLPLLVAPTDAGTPHLAHTLSHLAHLLTVTSLLRAVPALVAKRELNFPADVKEQHGVVDEEVFRKGAAADGFRDAAFTIATRGIDELITARRDLKKDDGKVVPAAGLPIFLSAVPAERYLKRLEQADFDVFSPQLQKHDWRLAPSIFWAAQTGKI